jgi:hypothetical protein
MTDRSDVCACWETANVQFLHVHHRLDRVHHPEVDDRVHPDGHVVFGDALLSRDRHRDDLHVDLLHAVDDRPDHRQPRTARRRLDLAEPEHDALLELLHHPDRKASRDHAEHDKHRHYDHNGLDHRHQPLSGQARRLRPWPGDRSHARPRPTTLSANTYHGRPKF